MISSMLGHTRLPGQQDDEELDVMLVETVGDVEQDGGSHSGADLLTGVFFSLLAFSWFLQYALARRQSNFSSSSSSSSSPPSLPSLSSLSCISRLTSSLPVAPLASLLFSGVSIILTVLLPTPQMSLSVEEQEQQQIDLLQKVTLYLVFSLSGLLSTISFYSSLPLPRHLPLLATCLAFFLEAATLPSKSNLLHIAVLACLLLSVARLLLSSSTTSSSSLLLCLLTQCQGSWIIHLSQAPPAPTWTATYFSWHLLGVFAVYTILLLLIQRRGGGDKNLDPNKPAAPLLPKSSTSSSPSPASSSSTNLSSYSPAPLPPPRSGRESNLFYEQEANESKTEKIRSVLATIEQMMEEGRSIDSVDTLSEE